MALLRPLYTSHFATCEAAVSKLGLRKLGRAPMGPWERRVATREMRAAHSGYWSATPWRDYCLVNNRYSVQLSDEPSEWGVVVHLWIRRHDGEPTRSWSDLQRIKRECVEEGAVRVAVEVFPADEQLVDQANMYHLWVLPLGFELPFSLVRP